MVDSGQRSTVNNQGQLPEPAVARAWGALDTVMDPEVPVLSIVELGIVREVGADSTGRKITVTITPTYSGCPAMRVIEAEMTVALEGAGFGEVVVKTVYAPAWTTDWMSEAARQKLLGYGIAPPGPAGPAPPVALEPPSRGSAEGSSRRPIACPFCGSADTTIVSEFGATACKSLHLCRGCRQPFEHFKAF